MITRLESCTKETRGRLVADLALVFLATAYIGFVLFDDVESPLLSIVLVAAVGYELLHARRPSARDLDSQPRSPASAGDCDDPC